MSTISADTRPIGTLELARLEKLPPAWRPGVTEAFNHYHPRWDQYQLQVEQEALDLNADARTDRWLESQEFQESFETCASAADQEPPPNVGISLVCRPVRNNACRAPQAGATVMTVRRWGAETEVVETLETLETQETLDSAGTRNRRR